MPEVSERVAAAIEARVKASVLPERPPCDGSVGLAHFVGATFRDLADVALAALAADPGDLPARMAEAIRRHDPDAERGLVNGQAYCVCGDLVEDWNEHWATAALSVRWEDHTATLAENAQLRARAEHAEGELSSRIEQHQRAENRATAAEGEVERLRAELANRDKLIEKYRETVGVVVGQREAAKAERDALKAAIGQIRADAIEQRRATGVTKDPWKLGVYAQACRTLGIFNAAMDAPETPDRDAVYEIPDEDVIAAPESPADAPMAVAAATEAHGRAGEAEEG